jgi:copper(I)-binding protein
MRRLFGWCFGIVPLATLLAGASPAVSGEEFRVGDLVVELPWARATAGRAPNGVVYMSLSNRGDAADWLVAVATPIAARAGVHETLRQGGVMTMRGVKRLEIPPGGSTTLQPGGLHVMLMGLRVPIEKGQTFPLTLTFERAGVVEVRVAAQGIGTMHPER